MFDYIITRAGIFGFWVYEVDIPHFNAVPALSCGVFADGFQRVGNIYAVRFGVFVAF